MYWYINTFCPTSWVKPEIKIPLNKSRICLAKISAHSIEYSFKIQSCPKALPHFNDLIAIVIGLSSSGDLSFKQLKS